jgi:ATP-dependent helicase/nuclease subunit A
MNELRIYRSSAGSGKTYMLVLEYLKLVLRNPREFRHILAVTFTNKAAEEMKSRIISALKELSEGKNQPLHQQLRKVISRSIDIKVNAGLCLSLILHNYSDFSVTTIDSFFFRIIRSVAKEMNLPAGLDVEIDSDKVIESISDELFAGTGTDEKLTKWLTNLVLQKISDDGHWRIEREIETIAAQLFKGGTVQLTSGITHEVIDSLFAKLITIRKSFESILLENGEAAIESINKSGLAIKDFYYGKVGVAGYFEKLSKGARGKEVLPNSYTNKAYDEGIWYSDKSAQKEKINQLVEQELQQRLENIYSTINKDGEKYFSANEVLRYLYLLGIAGDLSRTLAVYRSENKVVLVADNARLISEFISADDTPFVFDKTGTRYHHFLIDEFQDTSVLQWNNLLPLIRNSLAEGNFTLIVGDVKQSIYRWRGGETKLLAGEIKNNLKDFSPLIKEEKLMVNRRSKKNIVEFNNLLFSSALTNLNGIYADSLASMYSEADVIQEVDEHNKEGGYVEVDFPGSDANGNSDNRKFKAYAMEKVLTEIRELLDEGFEYRDIALLFRNNADGNAMAEFLLRNGISKVISPDSLLLTGSPAVRFLVSALRYVIAPTDIISKKHLHYYYALHAQQETPAWHPFFSDGSAEVKLKDNSPTLFDIKPLEDNRFNKTLPAEFVLDLPRLRGLSVFELCEELLRIFSLNKIPDAFVLRFQDCVLEHSRQRNSSVLSFLEWWDENKNKEGNSVLLPESENAIRIMTIHKAKGLQFPVVFIPFFNWNIFPQREELMWISSSTQPFDEAQTFPVRYGSSLEKTFFKEQFIEERKNYVSDALNLMYVACTRPMERLYIYSEKVKTPRDEPKKVSDILVASLNEMNNVTDLNNFYLGKKTKSVKPQANNSSSSTLEEYISNNWRNKISVSEKSSSLSIMAKEYMKKINFGTAAHKVMSYIKLPSDLEPAINKLFYAGMLNAEAKDAIASQLKKIFENETLKKFFTDEWQILSEREILFPDATALRPDRIMIKDKHAVILDFKTGKEKPADAAQIKHYADALEKLGYQPVEKYLVYLADGKIIPA